MRAKMFRIHVSCSAGESPVTAAIWLTEREASCADAKDLAVADEDRAWETVLADGLDDGANNPLCNCAHSAPDPPQPT